MLRDPSEKYRPFSAIDLPDRQWPSRTITRAPRWLSTDMRDGNQALIDPMDGEKKARFFDLLVGLGLKEIEVGFPAAGATEFDFIQGLMRGDRIPEDVTVQVLTQSRRDLIETSFASLAGARTAIVHLYNAISPAWRRIVFGMERGDIQRIAVDGAKVLRDQAAKYPATDWRFEYSPETFSTAELDFSVEVCAAVMEVLQPTVDRPLILNLPATVEAATPNIYADQIEWFARNIPNRDRVVLSLHTHNDRGTGVAATELGLLAGGDRVEGCLLGNGERTGNVDLVTVALNMYTQGVDPAPRLVGHRRGREDGRILHRDHDASAQPLCRRAGVHRIFGQSSGRDQKGICRAGGAQRRLLGSPLSANRSRGSGAQL